MSHSFRPPRPNFHLMWLLGFVNRWWMLEGLPILHRIPVVRDLPIVRGHFRIRSIDFPAADRDRFMAAVNRNTAAFVGPNHPEFGFDWMMDKHIQTVAAPRMASWAAHGIVATAPWFWQRNNLIAHNGGEAAVEFSIGWAMQGDGVLLHPEGMVRWTGDVVHPLFPGIAEMACSAAPRGAQPVFIVPIVWKLRYLDDISTRLHAEMGHIERHLGLDAGSRLDVAERFRALQENILKRQMVRHGFDCGAADDRDYFARQDAFRNHLIAVVGSRYTIEPGNSIDRTIARYQRVISAALRALRGDGSARATERRASLERDLAMMEEASRLGGFIREAYGAPTLTQEQIAESLKRHRATLVTEGLGNAVHNFLPTPHGARAAHVRVPAPILVDPPRAAARGAERKAYVSELLDTARTRMQCALDEINREIATEVARFSQPNPFAVSRQPSAVSRSRSEMPSAFGLSSQPRHTSRAAVSLSLSLSKKLVRLV